MSLILELDITQYRSASRWLNRLGSDASREVNRRAVIHWMTWLRENNHPLGECDPDDLINFQLDSFWDRRRMFEVLDSVQDGVDSHSNLRYKTALRMQSCVRSFFLHNRAELPRDKTWRPKAGKPRVREALTAEEITSGINASNECYRGIFSCMTWGLKGINNPAFFQARDFILTLFFRILRALNLFS